MRKTRAAEGYEILQRHRHKPAEFMDMRSRKRLPGCTHKTPPQTARRDRSQWTAANLSRFDDRENDNATIRSSVCSHCPFCFRPIARLSANIPPGHGTDPTHILRRRRRRRSTRVEVTCVDDGRTDMGGTPRTRAGEEICSSPHKTMTRASLPGFLVK